MLSVKTQYKDAFRYYRLHSQDWGVSVRCDNVFHQFFATPHHDAKYILMSRVSKPVAASAFTSFCKQSQKAG